MEKKLQVTIITPSGSLFNSDKVDHVVAKGVSGEMTLLINHAPIFTKLAHGELVLKIEGKLRTFTVFEGFLNMTADDKVTILADNAQRTEELNLDAIKKAKADAEKALSEKEKLSVTEILRAETAMRRAIMELQVAQKKNRLN